MNGGPFRTESWVIMALQGYKGEREQCTFMRVVHLRGPPFDDETWSRDTMKAFPRLFEPLVALLHRLNHGRAVRVAVALYFAWILGVASGAAIVAYITAPGPLHVRQIPYAPFQHERFESKPPTEERV
jgi:hypothetical protein